MTKSDWIKINRGGNCGQDFDRSFLEEIYDRIAASRFNLKDNDDINDEDVSENNAEQMLKDYRDEILKKKFRLNEEGLIIIKGNV